MPTAVDRVIQQGIMQVLSPMFEPQFSETSYGFRPRRSAQDAIKKSCEYANEGYTYVVDMDLEKFFDVVNQSKMIEIISRTVKDGRVVSLVNKYLKAGIKTRVHSKSIVKMKNRIREITARNNALGYENLKKKLKEYVTGWINYFKLADMKSLENLD